MRGLLFEIRLILRNVLIILGLFFLVWTGQQGWYAGLYEREYNAPLTRLLLEDPVGLALHCVNPCTVAYSPGGNLLEFANAAEAINDGARTRVIFDGPCASACSLFASMVAEKACITRRARFGFHNGRRYEYRNSKVIDEKGLVMPKVVYSRIEGYSDAIYRWVNANGGWPNDGVLWMNNQQAAKFWRRCEEIDSSPMDSKSQNQSVTEGSPP